MDDKTPYKSLVLIVSKEEAEKLCNKIWTDVPCTSMVLRNDEVGYREQEYLFDRELTNEDVISLTRIMLDTNVIQYLFSN
ncbi:MAG: hypothetical protein ABIF40_04420 [archaeon]